MTATVPYPRAVSDFPRLRRSLLEKFNACPLSTLWWLLHEEGQGWTTAEAARGKIVHRTIAQCLDRMWVDKQDEIPAEHAVDIYYNEVAQRDVDRECYRCGAPDPEGIGGGKLRCQDCGHEYFTDVVPIPSHEIALGKLDVIKWANDNVWTTENLAGIEERMEATVTYPNDEGPPVERTISGTPDCLFFDGATAIVPDFKGTWALPPESGVSERGYFWMRVYGLLVMRNYDSIQQVILREYYLRHSESREATILRADLPEVESELSALVERFDRSYEQQLWRPQPGSHCTWCAQPSKCPILPEARRSSKPDGGGMVTNEKEARRAIRVRHVAKAVVDRTTKALKAYTNIHGPQEAPKTDKKGRRQLGYTTQTRVERPTREQLERALRRDGADVDLDTLYRRRKQTRFEEHAVGPIVEPTAKDAELAELLRKSIEDAGG